MKRIFTTTTFLIALLAIGLIGLNNNNHNNSIGNAFAQMDPEDSAMMEDMEMNEDMMTISNQSDGMKMMNWSGTIDVKSTIGEAFKSKVTVNIIDAINVAQTNVGASSFVKKAELTPAHGYLVYKIMVVDENMKKYKVIVDPGNGQVLMKKEVTWYGDEEEHKMKYGEEKYNKYNHDDDYDQKKMMKMTKDEKY